MGVQLEVVLAAKELLADLALELAARTVRGDVAAQVPLAGKHLSAHRNEAKSQQHRRDITELNRQKSFSLYKKHKQLTVTALLERKR